MILREYLRLAIREAADAARAERVAVFDFDGTLFRSPPKPDDWPHRGYWGRIESLMPPLVPLNPGAEWWIGQTVDAAKDAIADPTTHTVLLTGRLPKLSERVTGLLNGAGLRFDEYHFASGTSTLSFKKGVLSDLHKRFPGALFELWEDREEHIPEFESLLIDLGASPIIHKVV